MRVLLAAPADAQALKGYIAAQAKSGPRLKVEACAVKIRRAMFSDLFSTSLPAWMIAHAHGCRIDSASIGSERSCFSARPSRSVLPIVGSPLMPR